MSLLASIALAAAGAAPGNVLPHCSWDKPGVNPFMGDVVAAVDRYQDIPVAARERLKARMLKRDYDELVTIQRDGIQGQAQYGSEIRDMHFGANSICKTVSRAKWTQQYQERGLVYCEDGQCILVPTVCRNVSRIQRLSPKTAAGGSTVASAANESVDPQTPLEIDPPSAGPMATAAPTPANSFSQIASGNNDGFDVSSLPPTGAGFAPPAPAPSGFFVPSLPPGTNTIPPVVPGIPEPGTWAMLMAGLLAVGFVARRRST
ncbi:MHFG family PEP-CTERM protein [Paucibacter sp. AS339]|uniref:MHFG family PEP-CTERM protein n=1 Tax=Paucibacter hankyongi TaxID=3133434 RepID=UPI0030964C3E